MDVQKKFSAGIKPQRRTIFHELIDPSTRDDEERPIQATLESLSGEALSFCTAAADTTGNALETSAYYVVTNPLIYATLTKELREAFPDPNAEIDYATLEKLPYLTAVIKEGQRCASPTASSGDVCSRGSRLSYGVISRLPRVTPSGGATFNGHYLAKGVRPLP